MNIVIPAGGEIEGDFAAKAGGAIRALAPIGGRPVLQLVVDALRASGAAGRIVVIGPEALQSKVDGVDRWLIEPGSLTLPNGASISGGPANVLMGLRELTADRPALMCTSDLPFLTAEAVADFVDRLVPGASLTAGLLTGHAYTERFPDAPESRFVPLADAGPSTLGCLFAVRPEAILGKMDLVMQVFNARKSQWGMVRLLGPRLLWEFAIRRMSARSIVARVEKLLDCDIGLVENAAPETAFDIDTVEDYLYANMKLSGTGRQ